MPDTPKIQFTPAQAAAIGARGGSLLVSAAAGSGKTRVLVERVVGLITDPHHPVEADRLLIMTFTNAAAAKLRADIATRLADEVRAHPEDVRLRRQQLLLQRASIGTVDAFCLHFVQQHFAALDVPPDFETAEEADLARIEQETLADVLEEAYHDPDFRAFADLYDRGRTDQTAGNAVLELYHFSRSLPHSMQALQSFAEQWQNGEPPQDTPWGQDLLRIARDRARGAQALLEAGARTAARDEAADAAYTAVLQDDVARVEWLCQKLEQADWNAAVAALEELGGSLAQGGAHQRRQGFQPRGFRGQRTAGPRQKQIAALRTDFLLCTAEEYEEDRRRAAPLVAALVRVTRTFADACFAAKCEEKLLDYADFEHLTLDLLIAPDGSRTPLCRTVSERYAAVLVDEYQDTNALQDAIYFALASPAGDNLFFVGDIKQSIYRFRQADPAVFLGKQQRWQPYPQPEPQPATLALDANFRSAPGVIEGIKLPVLGVFLGRAGRRDLRCRPAAGGGQTDENYPGLCEVDVLDGADAAGDAAGIARRIAEMVKAGFAVRTRRAPVPAGMTISASCCGAAPISRSMRKPSALPISRCLPIRLLTCWMHLTSGPLRPCCGSSTIPPRIFLWRRCCSARCFPTHRTILWRCAVPVPRAACTERCSTADNPALRPSPKHWRKYRRLARTLPVDRLLEETAGPHRLSGGGGSTAGRRPLPGGSSDLCGLGRWCRPGGSGGAGTRHGFRGGQRRPQPERRRTDPSRLRQHHDGAPLQGTGIPRWSLWPTRRTSSTRAMPSARC